MYFKRVIIQLTLQNLSLNHNYVFNFANGTQIFQINDARQIPIIIPSGSQNEGFTKLFDSAYETKRKYFDKSISKLKHDKKLG